MLMTTLEPNCSGRNKTACPASHILVTAAKGFVTDVCWNGISTHSPDGSIIGSRCSPSFCIWPPLQFAYQIGRSCFLTSYPGTSPVGITDSEAPESTATDIRLQLLVTALTAPPSRTVVKPLMLLASGVVPASPNCVALFVSIAAIVFAMFLPTSSADCPVR